MTTDQFKPSEAREKAYQRMRLLLKEARIQGATQDEPTGDILLAINHLDQKYLQGKPQLNILRNAFDFEKSHREKMAGVSK